MMNLDDLRQDPIPVRRMLRLWKTRLADELVAADSTGTEVTGKSALVRALILRRLLRNQVLASREQEPNVGLLLPPSVPAMLANVSLTLDRRVAVNLNYTASHDTLNHCIYKARLQHIITSRKVMAHLDFSPDCELVYLEDFVPKITLWTKLISLYQARFWSLEKLYRKLELDQIDPDDTMAILFTSGSTGTPKGVMLSHRNLSSNTDSAADFFHLTSDDRLLCALPFFHSLGFMATLWADLSIGMRPFYHYSPLDCKAISKLCRKYHPTIFMGTPSFLRLYLRRLQREDFTSVNQIMLGAERCPVELMDESQRCFGVRPVQGYGITETSPIIAANLSRLRMQPGDAPPKDESLGRPLPRVSVKVLNLDTNEPCQPGEVGMLWVSGQSVMKGYYDEPELTADVIQDGWYRTGDLVSLDEEGYILLAGRLSRFAKIAGEMVPHEGLEEVLNQILANPIDEPPKLCVTSVPDARKGEKIVVLYTELSRTPAEINAMLLERKIPPLWIPAQDAYRQITAIPLLGTGKLDLYTIQQVAMQQFADDTLSI
ncbi:MAG: AMP-binding protein [Planctomycetia bacterium]|nr:AMP-binding protein [Planctomycetia bacterium]